MYITSMIISSSLKPYQNFGPDLSLACLLMFSVVIHDQRDGCKSKRPLVKTLPSQNVPELVKTSPNTKKDWSKRPHKTSPFFKGDVSKKYGILTKKKLVLVSDTNV